MRRCFDWICDRGFPKECAVGNEVRVNEISILVVGH